MGRGRPYYQQMRDDIKKKIQCGDYKRGQYLPCEKKLEEEYGVSRTTVRSAISELVQDGYLYIVRGKGTKVAYSRLTDNNPNLLSFTEIVKSHGYEPQILQRSFEIIRADEKLAKKLGIGAGEEAVHIYRVRGTDDEPVSINDSYLPGKILGEQGAEFLLDGESMYENLKRHYHIAVTEVKEEIWAVSAGKYEAETLDVEENANSHFLRPAGPHFPASQGHIKRPVLEIGRAERGLRPANQYRALSQKAMLSQSVR